MINEQIARYVATERARGVADADIRTALLAKGWVATDVDAALGSMPGTMSTGAIPGVFDLISHSWDLFTNKYQLYLTINILPIITAVLTYLLIGQFADSMMSGGAGIPMISPPGEGHTSMMPSLHLIGTGLVMGIISAVVASFSIASTIVAIKDETITSAVDAWSKASGIFVGYFITSFVTGILTAAGFILLIVPGVFVVGRYGLASLISVFEGKGTGEAMMRSKTLATGREWVFAGKMLAGTIVITIVLNIAGSIVSGVLSFLPNVLGVVISGGFSAIATALVTIYLCEFYKSVSMRA